jgi:membrane protease YdiL (CAAX protease family)
MTEATEIEGRPETGALSRWLLVGATWGVGLALYFAGGVRLLDTILLTAMLVVLPGLALAQAAVLERLPFDRMAAYWSSIATLWVLGATTWLVGTRGVGAEGIALRSLPVGPFLGWTVGLTAFGVAVMLLSRGVGRVLGLRESPVLVKLLPRTGREKRVFLLLSVAAGVGEEIAFRGYAIPALAVAIGLPWSVAVTSVVFGVLHAYQGPIGIVRTALMGGALAGGMLLSGSLLPAILAHVLVDVVGGLFIADRFVEDPCRNDDLER